MGDWAMIIFLASVIIGFFVFLIIWGIMIDKHNKANNRDKKTAEELIEESLEAEFENIEVRVKVVDQSCSAEVVGIKKPNAIEQYWVVFESDDGKSFKLDVPKEMYDGFETGQTGLLTMVDGELYSFEIDG